MTKKRKPGKPSSPIDRQPSRHRLFPKLNLLSHVAVLVSPVRRRRSSSPAVSQRRRASRLHCADPSKSPRPRRLQAGPTGFPRSPATSAAMASRTGMPKPSSSEGNAKIPARAYQPRAWSARVTGDANAVPRRAGRDCATRLLRAEPCEPASTSVQSWGIAAKRPHQRGLIFPPLNAPTQARFSRGAIRNPADEDSVMHNADRDAGNSQVVPRPATAVKAETAIMRSAPAAASLRLRRESLAELRVLYSPESTKRSWNVATCRRKAASAAADSGRGKCRPQRLPQESVEQPPRHVRRFRQGRARK